MNNNVEVQKSNEKKFKEVQIEQTNKCRLSTEVGKVTLVGCNLASSATLPRYKGIYKLFETFEEKLEEKIPFDISLNYIVLESLVSAFKDFENDEDAIKFFTSNIKAKNFFYMINDLSGKTSYHSSDKIFNKFLSSADTLRKLDSFYDEFIDIYEYSLRYGYSSLYLFEKVFDTKNSKENFLDKIFNTINQEKNIPARHIACNVLNEFYNEVKRPNLTEDSIDEYYHKMRKINEKWNDVLSKTEKNLCSIDTLYYLVTE